MARNIGPKHRLCRRVGQKLCDLDRCPVTRRDTHPGVHGPKGRPKLTEYGTQLIEKQKARSVYGLLERQFRLTFDRARRQTGDTGQILTQLLERRLDNAVFRLAFVKSRDAARQAVTHGHVTVNGKRVTIPSYQVNEGDVIGIRERSQASPLFRDYPKVVAQRDVPQWLAAEPAAFRGRIIRLPTVEDAPQPFQARSIVEFYSR